MKILKQKYNVSKPILTNLMAESSCRDDRRTFGEEEEEDGRSWEPRKNEKLSVKENARVI